MSREILVKRMLTKGILLAIGFSAISLLWRDPRILAGATLGSFLAVADFWLLSVAVREAVERKSSIPFWTLQGAKYAVLVVMLSVLFVKKLVDPLFCVLGFSILWILPILELGYIRKNA